MTLGYILMQNLRRNRLRTALTAVAFALPMAIFVAAISCVVALKEIGESNAKQLRLAVHDKTTLTNGLPERKRREIEALDPDRKRLRAVCGMRWFGGRVPDEQNTLTSLAADVDTFPIVYSDAGMTETDVEAWERERRACVVGGALAEQYAWSVGDRVELHSTVPPYLALEFRVVKIMTNPSKANFFFFRRDYLEESRKEAGSEDPICNVFWVKCHSVKDLRWLQVEIDRLFAGTSEATKTEDESAFGSRFTQAAGDIPSLMQAMAVVVVVIIALVAGNTMMMSFRERTRELAVFKAIGFASGRIFAIVLGESVLLALIGALIGIVPTAAILLWYPVRRLGFGPITSLEVSSFAVIASFVIALTIGLVSGLWPAIQSLRLQTTDALRRVA